MRPPPINGQVTPQLLVPLGSRQRKTQREKRLWPKFRLSVLVSFKADCPVEVPQKFRPVNSPPASATFSTDELETFT